MESLRFSETVTRLLLPLIVSEAVVIVLTESPSFICFVPSTTSIALLVPGAIEAKLLLEFGVTINKARAIIGGRRAAQENFPGKTTPFPPGFERLKKICSGENGTIQVIIDNDFSFATAVNRFGFIIEIPVLL